MLQAPELGSRVWPTEARKHECQPSSRVQALLALRWREWMSKAILRGYMGARNFYHIHVAAEIDNPDQRLSSDIENFTATALQFVFTILTAAVDLACFSGILFSIHPPLFAALAIYALGGSAVSILIGKARAASSLARVLPAYLSAGGPERTSA